MTSVPEIEESRRRSLACRLGLLVIAIVGISLPSANAAAGGVETGTHEVSLRLEVPADCVWRVVSDIEGWSGFIPGVSLSTLESDGQGRIANEMHVERFGFEMHYRTLITAVPERGYLHQVLDAQRESDAEVLENTWRVIPLDDGRATRLELVSRYRSKLSIPVFVERRLLRQSAALTLEAVAKEVDRRVSSNGHTLAAN